ncbi:MAG TPA: C40 family peptidase [Streptomyces sp.]|uniref:C40 family peptidase n=1 Tax=Streptomyces sp. TaxID=1931 RepID=UPI002D49B71C|nr:C40 family peptidase [Streptomyces sp.]HZG05517.1 C40 family peptidase [Streptomyces sp.]
MSQTAHIRSHRKPRRAGRNPLLRTGVAGGVLSTLAVTAAATPSSAEEKKPVADTVELPTITSDLTSGAQQAVDATQAIAVHYEAEAARTLAAEKAMDQARKRAEAEAEAERRAAEAAEAARRERAERAAQERAARDSQRTTLTAAAPAPTGGGNVATLIGFLRAQVGKSYVLGATGPSAYDCSGLTQAAFRQLGISLPRTSQSQSTAGTQVSLDSLQPGDILYWGGAGSAYHVAVYIGDGRFIGAQNPSTGIVERDLSYDMPSGAVRVL